MATSIHETVLVGICDGAIDKKKNTSYCTNKIGDRPDLFPIITLQYPICSLCQRGLSHVVQVYCPLAASPYHRTINVFGCTNPQCSGKSESWTVLRSQCLDDDIKGRQDNKTTTCTEPAMSRTDWCEDADDWGMDEEEQENVAESGVQEPNDSVYEETDVSSKLQGLCIDGGVDQQSALQPTHVHVFQSFYISVMEETDLDGFHDTDHENELLREYEEREGVIVGEIRSCGSGEAQEEYEKATVKHGDEVFTGFMKKISLCPEQVLRKALCVHKCFHQMTLSNYIKCQHFPDSNIWYAWNPQVPDVARIWADTMLLSGLLQQQHEPRCLIREQVTLNESVRKIHKTALKDTPLEFGTVLVYTCRNSCWKSGSTVPVEEFLFVQPDPDQKLFK